MAAACSGPGLREALAQQGEGRAHLYLASVGEGHLGARLEGGNHTFRERERLLRAARGSGRPEERSLRLVPHGESIVLASRHDVHLAQEAAVVAADQEGEIGLLAQIVGLVETLLDHHLAGGQRQGDVGAGARREPEIGVDRALAVVGSDGDDLRPAVSRLVDEVGVGNPRDHRVESPHHQVVGAEPVVGGAVGVRQAEGDGAPHAEVADLRHGVGDGSADLSEEAQRRRRVRPVVDVRSQLQHDALAAALGQHVDQRFGDLVEGLLPADSLEASGAARPDPLHGVGDARGAQGQITAASALLAAARVEVGNARVRLHVRRRLLLAPDDSFADVQIPGTRRHAVHIGVGAANHLVPGPALAIDVAKVVVAGCQICRGRSRCDPTEPVQTQSESGCRTRLKELPPSQGCHVTSPRAPSILAAVDDDRPSYPPGPGGGMTTVIGIRGRLSEMRWWQFAPAPARLRPVRDPQRR